jgi:hypothetical protein
MLAQEGALSELVQQHLRAKGKLGTLQRQSKSKLLVKKVPATNGNPTNTNGSANERSPKTVKRRRTGTAGRKKTRKKK